MAWSWCAGYKKGGRFSFNIWGNRQVEGAMGGWAVHATREKGPAGGGECYSAQVRRARYAT